MSGAKKAMGMKLELNTLWMSIFLVPTHSSCLKFGPEPKHPTLQRLVRQGLCPFATTHFTFLLGSETV